MSAAIASVRPDVIATDYLLLGSYVAAERAGLPLAALVHTVYPLPAPGIPPYGLGLKPATGVIGRVRDTLVAQIFRRFYDAGLAQLNHLRADTGLQPVTSVFQQFYRASRLLVLTSQAFDLPARALPPDVRYVGAQLDDPAWLQPWEAPVATADHLPLVVVSLSTTYQHQEDLLKRVIAALAELPVQGLVTLGPALSQRDFAFPPNVTAAAYIPHILLCPQADLVVTHGGLGTIMTALTFGKPLVCMPMGRDQSDNAVRVVYRDAGVACSSKAGVAELRRVIGRALEDQKLRLGAQRVAAEMASESGPRVAIEEMERLASILPQSPQATGQAVAPH